MTDPITTFTEEELVPDNYDWPTISRLAEIDLAKYPYGRKCRTTALSSPNFMTPDHLKTITCGGLVIEVSTGIFLNTRLYGVTIDHSFDVGPDPRSCPLLRWVDVVTYLNQIQEASQ